MLILLALAGCAGDVQGTEHMLAASGFAMEPANTPQTQNELALLPPHQLVLRSTGAPGEAQTYAYADPDICHCLWVGNAQNYQYFEHLLVQQQIANQNMEAAQMNENAALQWSMPPPPVVIVHEHR
jgi:hypothetical protein